MKGKRRNCPAYDLSRAKELVVDGKYYVTIKGMAFLASHGGDEATLKQILLSLKEDMFWESLHPGEHCPFSADVYRCAYCDNDFEEELYLKFLIEGDYMKLGVMSCKRWGYGW